MEIYLLREATEKRIQMMSLVFRAENGDLAVMDGGNWGDGEHLLAALRALGGERPRVKAWLLTHAHSDHVDALRYLFAHHRGEFFVDALYCDFPELSYFRAYEPTEAHTLAEMRQLIGETEPSLWHRVAVGDTVPVGEMTFSVLQTPDSAPTSNVVNNASVVYRLEGEGVSALFLGDLGVEGGRRLLQSYGLRLKSDIVQMAHHGQNGVERPVYEAICPDLCLWPTPKWLWDNDPGQGYNSGFWKTLEVRCWMQDLGVGKSIATWQGDHRILCRNSRIRVENADFTGA